MSLTLRIFCARLGGQLVIVLSRLISGRLTDTLKHGFKTFYMNRQNMDHLAMSQKSEIECILTRYEI